MDRKNTILLTVIAVATLLVAVVGATFAFFTAQMGNPGSADVKVKTETTNSTTIRDGGEISILANQFNFAEQDGSEEEFVGSQKGSTTAAISFTASSGASEAQNYCYTVDLIIDDIEKPFVYTPGHDSAPELVFNISKASGIDGEYNQNYATSSDNDAQFKSYDGTTNTIPSLVYKASVLSETKICDNKYTPDIPDTETWYSKNCQTGTISGFDITTTDNTTFNIPKLSDDEEISETTGTKANIHVISAEKNVTKTDYWRASVIFVNHPFDQEPNTGKEFNAHLKFTPVDCSTGTAPAAD